MPAKTISSGTQTPGAFTIVHEFPPSELETAWRECLARVDLPSHYNAPEYFLSPLWKGKRPFAVLARQGLKITGVLTGIHDGKNLISGLQSRPQICFDSTSDRDSTEQSLAQGLFAEADGESLITVYSWTLLESFRRLGFRHRQLEGNVVLDLTIGPQALLKQFHESRRRNIKAAIRNGIEVFQASNREDLLEYYEVYLRWLKTERKKIVWKLQSREDYMQTRALTENSRLFVARYQGKIIAGIIVRFYPGGLLEFASNSSLDEFLNLRPNELLQWRAMEWACQEGFKKYSLGGAHLFLRRLGGTLVPIHRYRLDRTLLRHHDLREAARDFGRKSIGRMPAPVEKTVRRLLGKGNGPKP